MALHEEAANERLYRWTLNVLRTISSDIIEVHPQLFRAMACLQEREILFKYCLDEYVTVRRSAIVRNFIEALTRGRPNANTSAIELHSNDVIRYVGDMLAFLHQSVANEKEMIDTLLKMCDKDKLQSSGMAMVQSYVSYISRDVHGGEGLDKNPLVIENFSKSSLYLQISIGLRLYQTTQRGKYLYAEAFVGRDLID